MSYDLTRVKILIVEDMQPMLALTTSILTMFGFKTVHGARNVQDGYAMFKQHNHDLIVTDWLMDPHDGIDLVRMVRKNEDSPNTFVPIILMTGYSDQSRVEEARDMGVTEFLMKPYSARDMYARIVQIIEKPRQYVQAGEFFGPDRRRRKDFNFYGQDRRGTDVNASKVDAGGSDELEIILRETQTDLSKI